MRGEGTPPTRWRLKQPDGDIGLHLSDEFNEVGSGGDVFDDLGGLGADAEVAEVGELFGGGPGLAGVGDVEGGFHHRGDVALGVFRQFREVADF
jgi:hypothetical protein